MSNQSYYVEVVETKKYYVLVNTTSAEDAEKIVEKKIALGDFNPEQPDYWNQEVGNVTSDY